MATQTERNRAGASDLRPVWHVIDAEGKTLGRLSTEVAVLLQGKHKPTYVPYLVTGDFVIVVNAEKIRVSGRKLEQKVYYRHSGYHGGLKEATLSDVLKRSPTRALKQSVKGMLPKNSLGRRMLSRLKLYAGASHPHEAQVNARRRPAEEEAPPDAAPKAGRGEKTAAPVAPEAVEQQPDREAAEAEQPPAPKPKRARAKPKASATATPEAVEQSDREVAEAEQPPAPKPKRTRARPKSRTKAEQAPDETDQSTEEAPS